MSEKTELLKKALMRAKQEVAKVIIGQEHVVDKALIAIFSGNHALIEGVPGVAKTLLVRTLAHVMRCDFARIQFTPDLMPADILGTNIVKEDAKGSRHFEFYKGPIFGQLILADDPVAMRDGYATGDFPRCAGFYVDGIDPAVDVCGAG